MRGYLINSAFLFLVMVCAVAVQAQEDEKASAQTLKYGVVIDNSGTFRFALEKAVRLLAAVVREQNEGDEGFLLTYTDPEGIFLKVKFTSDIEELADSIENIYVEAGRTAVWDALYAAADQFEKITPDEPVSERRLIFLVTDGDQKGSSLKPDLVLKRLKERGVTVHVVGLAERKVDLKTVGRISDNTGGRKFVPVTADDLKAAAAELINILKGKDR